MLLPVIGMRIAAHKLSLGIPRARAMMRKNKLKRAIPARNRSRFENSQKTNWLRA